MRALFVVVALALTAQPVADCALDAQPSARAGRRSRTRAQPEATPYLAPSAQPPSAYLTPTSIAPSPPNGWGAAAYGASVPYANVPSAVPQGATLGVRRLPIADAGERALVEQVLDAIERGGPFTYRQDGVVFQNREGRLPPREAGYYHEYTVPTPGLGHRGARRIVRGDGGDTFYTSDHYRSFIVIDPRRY